MKQTVDRLERLEGDGAIHELRYVVGKGGDLLKQLEKRTAGNDAPASAELET